MSRFEVASVYELPFSDAAFDAAFANTLLLHLADPLRALREMRRVLKPGGVVAIADDDHSTLIFEPRTPLMTAMYQLIMRVVAHHGGDAYRARHYRQLLLEAGFARPVAGGTFGTFGAWGTPEDTRLIAAWMVDQVRAPAFSALATAQGWADAAALDAMAADVLAWGERPDACSPSRAWPPGVGRQAGVARWRCGSHPGLPHPYMGSGRHGDKVRS
jgi:SAM-dependent methyltransferase